MDKKSQTINDSQKNRAQGTAIINKITFLSAKTKSTMTDYLQKYCEFESTALAIVMIFFKIKL